MRLFFDCLLFAAISFFTTTLLADEMYVAVAANFAKPMEKITADFAKATGHKAIIVSGSSGKLLEQVRNGAPFEIFLSADQGKPQRVEEEKLGVSGSRFTYAIGKLVLWSAQQGVVDGQGAVLKTGNFAHLAISSPDTAPYGKAAMEAMTKLGVLETLQPKIVQGESIAQAKAFVSSGNAELGFVALSQVTRDGKIGEGSVWLVPPSLYSPMKQDAILLKTGENSAAAKALMDYLQSAEAKAVIGSFGYGMPEAAKDGQADAQ